MTNSSQSKPIPGRSLSASAGYWCNAVHAYHGGTLKLADIAVYRPPSFVLLVSEWRPKPHV